MDISDPIIWRGIKSLAVLAAAIVFGLLGYKIYLEGRSKEHVGAKGETGFAKFLSSGTGPGVVFMAVGAILVFVSLTSKYDPVSSPEEDLEFALRPLREEIRDQEKTIGNLSDQLTSQGVEQVGVNRRSQPSPAGRDESQLLEIINAQIIAHEERASAALFEAFEQQQQQNTLLNTILEDHESRITTLELLSDPSQTDTFELPRSERMPE